MAVKPTKQPEPVDWASKSSFYPADTSQGVKKFVSVLYRDEDRRIHSLSSYRHFRLMLQDVCLNAHLDLSDLTSDDRKDIVRALTLASVATEAALGQVRELGYHAHRELAATAGSEIRQQPAKLNSWCAEQPKRFGVGASFYVDKAIEALAHLNDWLEKAGEKAKPQNRRGAPSNEPATALALRMGWLWCNTTGRPPPRPKQDPNSLSGWKGDFVDFVDAAINPIWTHHGFASTKLPSAGHFADKAVKRIEEEWSAAGCLTDDEAAALLWEPKS